MTPSVHFRGTEFGTYLAHLGGYAVATAQAPRATLRNGLPKTRPIIVRRLPSGNWEPWLEFEMDQACLQWFSEKVNDPAFAHWASRAKPIATLIHNAHLVLPRLEKILAV